MVAPFMTERPDFQFPKTREGLTRKFTCGLDVYLTVNLKPTGEVGEVFVKLGKTGTTVSGLIQAWVLTISAALQRGVRWSELSEKYVDMKFEPYTHEYTSLVDAIARNIDQMVDEIQWEREATRGQLKLSFGDNGQQQPAGE